MQCRNCGADIADKALICYKCGTATTKTKFKAPAPRPPRSMLGLVLSVVAIVLFVVLVQFAERFLTPSASPTPVWVAGALAVAIVVLRAVARRR